MSNHAENRKKATLIVDYFANPFFFSKHREILLLFLLPFSNSKRS